MDDALVEQNRREFSTLMQRVQEGDEDAAWELLDEYGSHVINAIRRLLTERMRTKVDSTDFAQSVWASFYAQRSTADRFDGPEALMAYLTQIARNKVIDEFRRLHLTQKYDIDRERSLDGSARGAVAHLLDGNLSPSQCAVCNERLENLSPRYREVIMLYQTGMSCVAIARECNLNECTARRIIHFVLKALRE